MKNRGKILNLAGEWEVSYEKDGTTEKRTISLPGTMLDNNLGYYYKEQSTDHLTELYSYEGVAHYEKEVSGLSEFAGKHIELYMEMCHWESKLYIDDEYVGMCDSLAVGHCYEISDYIKRDTHTFKILVDNSSKYPVANHHTSVHTQTNWNGIVGEFCLRVTENVYVDKVKIDADANKKTAKVFFVIKNKGPDNVSGEITVSAANEHHSTEEYVYKYSDLMSELVVDITVNMGEDALLWSDVEPNLYDLCVTHKFILDGVVYTQEIRERFGLRSIGSCGKQLLINNKKAFLRGTHDACVFPLTGYPPTDLESWEKLFGTFKNYGLNHCRFHSWCPPKAAFIAADKLGIYLQPESPVSGLIGGGQTEKAVDGLSTGSLVNKFILDESLRINELYNNHPSFVMFSIGNELNADEDFLREVVNECRKISSNRFFAQGSNNKWSTPKVQPGDDFYVTFMTDEWDGLVRGSYHHNYIGHINNQRPSTNTNYKKGIDNVDIPLISHEVGQYLAYPDFDEINKYTGNLKPFNIESFKKSLETQNLAEYADLFHKASGALQVRLYKEEIEAALRTEGMGGFQLLDIKDYPGQGTALCGILDAFADSKGFITPDEWREFCSEIVPLCEMEKLVYYNDETLSAKFKATNFSGYDKKLTSVHICLKDIGGKVVFEHILDTDVLGLGLNDMGDVVVPIEGLAGKYILECQLNDGEYKNRWEVWIYPRVCVKYGDIHITHTWNREMANMLRNGEKVLLIPDNALNCIEGQFQTNFWCMSMFRRFRPAGTLGLYINPEHAAFADFPTDYHSNWQWYDVVKNSKAMIMDYIPKNVMPIVGVIDNYERNHKLSIIFEAKVGKGKLLVSSIDFEKFLGTSPVIDNLFNSVCNYMNSDKFDPKGEIPLRNIDTVVRYEG